MTIKLVLQIATEAKFLPNIEQFKKWISKTLPEQYDNCEITIRIVDKIEMTILNKLFRNKIGATNILSFPSEIKSSSFKIKNIGDIVICASIVNNESRTLEHWAHIVIHGILHLIGYDHINSKDAIEMETLEIKILANLGYTSPYMR